MIALDSSENKKNSKTIIPEKAVLLDWLEEKTGADAIISPFESMPLTLGTLSHHIQQGAVLVQIKHGADLISSIGNKMNEAVARMVENAPHAWQRVLIPVGIYKQGMKHGHVLYAVPKNSKPFFLDAQPPKKWEALQTALWRWRKRGGCVEMGVHNPKDLLRWMEREEIDLVEMKEQKKEVWKKAPSIYSDPEPDDPLQEVRVIKDGRVVLASLQGIGEGRAQVLWDFCDGKLYHAIMVLTDPDTEYPKGIGKKTVEKAREIFGFTDAMKFYKMDLAMLPEHITKEMIGEDVERSIDKDLEEIEEMGF